MRILEWKYADRPDDKWKPSSYRGLIAVDVMGRQEEDKAKGYKSNIDYRWKPDGKHD